MRKYFSVILLVAGAMYMASCSSCTSKNENKDANEPESHTISTPTNNVDMPSGQPTPSQPVKKESKVNTDEKETCTTCKGTGKVHGKQCNVCLGFGYLRILK